MGMHMWMCVPCTRVPVHRCVHMHVYMHALVCVHFHINVSVHVYVIPFSDTAALGAACSNLPHTRHRFNMSSKF